MRPAFERAGAEAAVVVAYGLKIPDWLLALHPRGAINVHGSLLPAYRGAAPVNRAIINGDAETGVTTMLLASRMDAGPMLLQRRTPIGPEETAGEVTARLAELGAGLLVVTLDGLASGIVQPREQDEALATFAPKMRKEDGLIDWPRGAREIVEPRARRQSLAGRVHAPRRQAAEGLEGGGRGAPGRRRAGATAAAPGDGPRRLAARRPARRLRRRRGGGAAQRPDRGEEAADGAGVPARAGAGGRGRCCRNARARRRLPPAQPPALGR